MAQVHTRQKTRLHAEADDNERTREKKRLRVSRACDECRRRKDRCDGRQPICRPCAAGNRQCNYNPMKKRGLPPGYVRAVELVLGLIFRSVKGSDSCISALLRGEVETPSSGGLSTGAEIECLLDTWRKSSVLKEVERALLAEATDDDDAAGQTLDGKFALAFSATATLHISHEASPAPLPPSDPSPLVRISTPPPPQVERVPSPITSPRQTHPSTMYNIGQASLPSNWSELLDVYFANTHCWFPIAQKHELLRSASLLTDTSSASQAVSLTAGEHAFLWTVIAYASRHCDVLKVAPDSCEGSNRDGSSSQELQVEAERLVTEQVPKQDIGHVRALLLLALLEVGFRSWTKAWSYVGQAVYLAVDLGCFPASSTPDRPSNEDGKKRTAIGCFILETLIASHLGRRPYLRRSDLHLVTLEADGIEEWEPWQPDRVSTNFDSSSNQRNRYTPGHVLSIFNSFAELIGILNDFTSTPRDEVSRRHLSDTFRNLNYWREQLPRHCQAPFQGNCSPNTAEPPQLINIVIASASVFVSLKAGTSSLLEMAPASPEELSHIRKSLDFAALQLHTFGAYGILPLSEIYLSTFNRPHSAESALLADDAAGCVNVSTILRGMLEKTWRGIRITEENSTGDTSRSRLSLSHDMATRSPRRQATITTPPASSLHTTVRAEIAPMLRNVQSESRRQQSNNGHHAAEDTPLQEGLSGSLATEHDDDNLFSSLALLDPVDWYHSRLLHILHSLQLTLRSRSANPPEFMERLGLTGGSIPADFESLFSV